MVIGFTVGVWDLFHEGHENFLKECKQHCDFLYVAIYIKRTPNISTTSLELNEKNYK